MGAILRRDGYDCQLCRRPVDIGLRSPDPMSASLDHIVPVARGGAHEMGNLRLAHRLCNVKRGLGEHAIGRRMLEGGACEGCGTEIPERTAARYHYKPPRFCSRRCVGS